MEIQLIQSQTVKCLEQFSVCSNKRKVQSSPAESFQLHLGLCFYSGHHDKELADGLLLELDHV